jgi:hypothetical protein
LKLIRFSRLFPFIFGFYFYQLYRTVRILSTNLVLPIAILGMLRAAAINPKGAKTYMKQSSYLGNCLYASAQMTRFGDGHLPNAQMAEAMKEVMDFADLRPIGSGSTSILTPGRVFLVSTLMDHTDDQQVFPSPFTLCEAAFVDMLVLEIINPLIPDGFTHFNCIARLSPLVERAEGKFDSMVIPLMQSFKISFETEGIEYLLVPTPGTLDFLRADSKTFAFTGVPVSLPQLEFSKKQKIYRDFDGKEFPIDIVGDFCTRETMWRAFRRAANFDRVKELLLPSYHRATPEEILSVYIKRASAPT